MFLKTSVYSVKSDSLHLLAILYNKYTDYHVRRLSYEKCKYLIILPVFISRAYIIIYY